MVTPAAAERRKADRRATLSESETYRGEFDRRRTPERRRGPFHRTISVASEYSDGWLCFESEEGEKRRLVWAPEGWENLPTERLWVLCRVATHITKPETTSH